MTELLFIRHGRTAGNMRHNYVGCTDEPLCDEGVSELSRRQYPAAGLLFCSPMLRCRQTASLLYPDLTPKIIDDMRECDFGKFENRNYQDLSGSKAYQRWLDSNGNDDFPGGETRNNFVRRCCRGFVQALGYMLSLSEQPQRVAFVIHGGTIMALLSQYTDADYYNMMCENGSGYCCRFDKELWQSSCRLPAPWPLHWEEK